MFLLFRHCGCWLKTTTPLHQCNMTTAKAAVTAVTLLATPLVQAFVTNGGPSPLIGHGVFRAPFSSTFRPPKSSVPRPEKSRGGTGEDVRVLYAAKGASNETPTWRLELDDLIKSASPWGSASEAEILAMDLLKRLPEVAEDVADAVRRGTLLSEVVLARGTEARLTVDGLRAVDRQLREDILPQALESAPRAAKAAAESLLQQRSSVGSGAPTRKRGDGRTGPMEGVAETLYAIRSAVKNLRPQQVRKSLEAVRAEAVNVVSRTPEGLYSPEYAVVDQKEEFEVRRYASYAVCSAPMSGDTGASSSVEERGETKLNDNAGASRTTAGSGEGFNTLAGYLFGNNTSERAMSMTTPVNIDVSPTAGRTMSFIMPKDIPAGAAPVPNDPRVGVRDVAEGETLAVREFPGFATDGEVRRQVDALLTALEREGARSEPESTSTSEQQPSAAWRAEDPSGRSYRLMQFNPPYTLPWLRTNAVAVQVSKDKSRSDENAEIVAAISDSVEGERPLSSAV